MFAGRVVTQCICPYEYIGARCQYPRLFEWSYAEADNMADYMHKLIVALIEPEEDPCACAVAFLGVQFLDDYRS